MNTTPGVPVRRTLTSSLIVILLVCAGAAAQTPDSGAASQPNIPTLPPGTSTPRSSGGVAAIENAADPSAAIEAYAKARADTLADPQLDAAYVHRMVALGAPHLAQTQAKEVVGHNPNDGVAWAVLAFCDGAMNNTTAALNELTSATRLAPDDEFVQYTAGQLLGWYDALGKASDLMPGLPEKLQFIKQDFANRPAFAETYKGALNFYKQQPPAGHSAGASPGASAAEAPTGAPADAGSSTSTPDDTSVITQGPSATVNQDAPATDANGLPPPQRFIIAEKAPFRLPNGQTLVLFDHKVGHDQVRYKVDGIEYKPHVGETVAFHGANYLVLVTCTRWKLLKKDYGHDSAEFQIECVPTPATQAPADVIVNPPTVVEAPVEYVPEYYGSYVVPTYYAAYPAWSVSIGFGWGYPWWGYGGWRGYHGWYGYGGRWYGHGGDWHGHGGDWHGHGSGNHVTPYAHGGYAGASHGSSGGSHGYSGGAHSSSGGGHGYSGAGHGYSGGGHNSSGGSHAYSGGGRSFGGVRSVGGGSRGFAGASHGSSGGGRTFSGAGRGFSGAGHSFSGVRSFGGSRSFGGGHGGRGR
ncbi:MAG TPA: hypothetical protein VMV94_09475 [Phycisphaerae bacterium]|nr:hypothetical protein [Phycisphaerae bacterium]